MRSLRWNRSKTKIMEVIEVDQLEDTNKERLRRAMPHSGLKPKDNDPKEKTTFHGRRPLMEGGLWWKTTFDGRQPLTEGDLWRKTTFDGRWPLTENTLWLKTTFDKRQLLTEDDHLKKCLRLLTLTATAQRTPNRKSYQLSKPEIEFHMMEETYEALCMCGCAEKTTFLGKDN